MVRVTLVESPLLRSILKFWAEAIQASIITGVVVYFMLEIGGASMEVAAFYIAVCAYWAALLGGVRG